MDIVIDPNGVVARGKSYPFGTPLADIPATPADIAAWQRFQQIGPELHPAGDDEDEAIKLPCDPASAAAPEAKPKTPRKRNKQP